MIKFEKTEVWGFEHAVRGMRNPLNSWDRSDSYTSADGRFMLGAKDRDLAVRLISGGQPHRKFLRQIFVSADITAPHYWWAQFDTYKVGTTANSCSKMHKLFCKPFEENDFSFEKCDINAEKGVVKGLVSTLNYYRDEWLTCTDEARKKELWYTVIQILPMSYNQKRTVTMNYETIINIMEYRKGHKLAEWKEFIAWADQLPYGDMLEEGLSRSCRQ